jgi:hypothetical protein
MAEGPRLQWTEGTCYAPAIADGLAAELDRLPAAVLQGLAFADSGVRCRCPLCQPKPAAAMRPDQRRRLATHET